jgi:dihydrofolate reductase
MRRLVLKMSVSIDGFVGGPNGEIDWIFRSHDPTAAAWIVDVLWQAGLHLMGSRTFADMRAWWPTSNEVYAAPMNEIPKVVFSRGGPASVTTTTALRDATRARGSESCAADAAGAFAREWDAAAVARGALAEEIARLKRLPGKDLLAHGGARFARSLVAEGLVDEFKLLVHPVALGRGLPLFADLPTPLDLELVASQRFAGGTVAQIYHPRRATAR